jgi:hypothetical protein
MQHRLLEEIDMPHSDRWIARRLRGLTGSVAALAVGALLSAATGALAAPAEGGSGFSGGGAGTAALAASGRRQVHPGATAHALAPGGYATFSAPVRPFDSLSGLIIAGNVAATWGSGQADMAAQIISNSRASASGDLTLSLVATTSPPFIGGFSGFFMASVDLGPLPAGAELTNFDTGTIPFTPPATNGCYYVSEVLEENDLVVDVRTFPAGGTPENSGFDVFPFGTTCPAAAFCTRNGTGACLLGGRFQVTAVYENDVSGSGPATVLSFGSTRAESDESVFYYFLGRTNFELGVKVLDACMLTNTFWVFIGGLTNQGWNVTVLDTQTGHHKTYGNALGVTTVTTTDIAALSCP